MLQRGAFEIFHDDERAAVLLADVVDRADVWMIERRSSTRFALKTGKRDGIATHFFREKL